VNKYLIVAAVVFVLYMLKKRMEKSSEMRTIAVGPIDLGKI